VRNAISVIRVLIVDDSEVVRVGLRCALAELSGIEVVAEAVDGTSAVLAALAFTPDVALMDLHMPNMDGIEATREIKSKVPNVRVLISTSNDRQQDVLAALGAGADGYCLKDTPTDQLLMAIKTVHAGATWLDPQIGRTLL